MKNLGGACPVRSFPHCARRARPLGAWSRPPGCLKRGEAGQLEVEVWEWEAEGGAGVGNRDVKKVRSASSCLEEEA